MLSITIDPLPTFDSLIHGHWGLDAVITFAGIVRVSPEAPAHSPAQRFKLQNVIISLEGRIFSSNGDARKHSPYEAFTFLSLGPIDFYADHTSISRDLLPQRYQQDSAFHVPLPPVTTTEDGSVEVPFRFPVIMNGKTKLHPSLEASNPEYGFGARIEYKVKASVNYIEGSLSPYLSAEDGINGQVQAVSSMRKSLPIFSQENWRHMLKSLFTSSIVAERNLTLIRYTPACLVRAMRTSEKKTWCSRTDVPPDTPFEASIVAMMNYDFSISPLVLGPGDVLTVKFKIKPKAGSKLKVVGVKILVDELQGVGVELKNPEADEEKLKLLGELAQMMADTTLGRKWMSKSVMGWEGKETHVGEFWKEQEVSLPVPPLIMTLKPQDFFAPTRIGVNPSGRFANRVQIEHKVNISIDVIIAPQQTPLTFKLSEETIFINGFSKYEAEDIVSKVPGLRRQLEEEFNPIESNRTFAAIE
ncbi:hypothetical protein HDU67_009610 [Dinochytrium kinnereticum]|nr:hypothetical protein HDU67_009610 [Dinochytrium kinnereticum]